MRNGIRALGLITLVGLLAITATANADDYPQGCVDCHTLRQTGGSLERSGDFRLNTLLQQVGHRKLNKVKTVPNDCARCHGDEDELPLSTMVHLIHYELPAANVFTTQFGGDCTNCHGMDAAEGEAIVKSGEKNW